MHKFLCLLIKKEIKKSQFTKQFTKQILEKIALQQTFHMILTMIFAKTNLLVVFSLPLEIY